MPMRAIIAVNGMVPMCGEIEHIEAGKGERFAIAKLSLVQLGNRLCCGWRRLI
jgi:hypothetical protein